jgi:hypothetical protein
MGIFKIAARVAQDASEAEFDQLLSEMAQKGYSFIAGLYDDRSGAVYWVYALCKFPDKWEPYRAPRHFHENDSSALWWYFDDELTAANNSGEMIYEESPDLEPDEEPAEVNQEKYNPADESDFSALSKNAQEQVLKRLRAINSGETVDRWEGAPRADQF